MDLCGKVDFELECWIYINIYNITKYYMPTVNYRVISVNTYSERDECIDQHCI